LSAHAPKLKILVPADTARPINVEIRRSYDEHVAFVSKLEPKLHDYQTIELTAQVDAGEKKKLDFTIVQRQGTSAKRCWSPCLTNNLAARSLRKCGGSCKRLRR
jgi:hypothetical protein